MNNRAIAAICFVMLLLSGYVTMGYVRHHVYEERGQRYISECELFVEKGIEKPMGWEDFSYIGSPEAARVITDPVFQDFVYSLYEDVDFYNYEYWSEIIPQLLEEFDNQEWSLWDAHKGWTILYYELLTAHGSAGTIHQRLGPHRSGDWCGSLAESVASWEAAGNERQGDWIRTYQHSSEYQEWLNQIFTEIALPKESRLYEARSVEEYVDNTQQLPIRTSVFSRDILEAERNMVEMAYDQYLIHTGEKDIVRAGIDAWIIQFRGSLLESASEKNFDTMYILRSRKFPFKDLIIDVCIITIFSVSLTVLVMRKFFKNSNHTVNG
ncbi:MAG: hypothetical protein HXS44_14185 [Theionarchaea archaeon]|nr:hypothetical protein [Theionarchaea archaeon]